MRKFKRTGKMAAVFAAAAMAMTATACGSSSGNAAGTAQTEASTEAVTESAAAETTGDVQTADTESTEADTEDGGTEASTIGGTEEETEISISDAWSQINQINENTKLKLSLSDQEVKAAKADADLPFTTKIQYVKVEDSGYDALQKALDKDNEESMALAEQSYGESADYLKEANESGENVTPYEIDSTVLTKRADEKVVSYLREDFSQLGGAHPSTYFTGKNYDAKTGEELSLKDVASNYDGVYQYVLDELAQREKEDGNENCYFDGYEETVKEMFYGASDDGSTDTADESEESGLYPDMQPVVQWYLEDDGLTVIFNDYDIAPYAYGPSAVKIPFDSGLLNSDYAG